MDEPRTLPCDQVLAQLWEYVDGELPDPASALVRSHLERCAHCFPQYDFDRAYRELVRRCADQAIPPELRQRVLRTILAEDPSVASGTAPTAGQHAEAAASSVWRRLFGRG